MVPAGGIGRHLRQEGAPALKRSITGEGERRCHWGTNAPCNPAGAVNQDESPATLSANCSHLRWFELLKTDPTKVG